MGDGFETFVFIFIVSLIAAIGVGVRLADQFPGDDK